MQFLLCAVFGSFAAIQAPPAPLVVSVWYNGPGVTAPAALPAPVSDDALRQDLEAIRRAGFNAITTWISWRDGEPRRGELDLRQLDRVVNLAAAAGLHTRVAVFTDDEPAWKKDGTNALAGRFFERVSDHYARRAVVMVRAGTSRSAEAQQLRVGRGGLAPRQARLELWERFAQGAREISVVDAAGATSPDLRVLGETAGILTHNIALFAPLVARTQNNRVLASPAGSIVSSVLESPDAIVIIARNASDRTRRVTLTFPPDLPEAIWQNMEAGNAVNFVMGKDGPFYVHTFAPHDALVLAIRKKLR